MKNKPLISILFSLMSVLGGCSDSMIGEMSRIIDDPVIVKPTVKSFIDEVLVEIEWEEDPGTDEYLLYRSLDTISNAEVVYRGKDLNYRDNDVTNETRYLYSLVKLRGDEFFGPSESVLGVASMNVEDHFEPNNEESQATPFVYNLSANAHYYVSEGILHTIEDRDWYSVEINPRMKSLFKIEVNGIGANFPTGLLFYQRPALPADIQNQVEIVINNFTYGKKIFYFCIYPDGAQIITNSNGGGRTIHYDLSYIGEQPL